MRRSSGLQAVLVAGLVLAAGGAGAAEVPDSTTRAALAGRIGRLEEVRILTPGGPLLLRHPAVTDSGLRAREPYRAPRPAIVVIGKVPAGPAPLEFVPWSRIDEVQVGGTFNPSSMAGSALLGGLAMLAISMPLAHSVETAGVPPGTVFTLGAGMGAVFGSMFGAAVVHWRTVYPERASR